MTKSIYWFLYGGTFGPFQWVKLRRFLVTEVVEFIYYLCDIIPLKLTTFLG